MLVDSIWAGQVQLFQLLARQVAAPFNDTVAMIVTRRAEVLLSVAQAQSFEAVLNH